MASNEARGRTPRTWYGSSAGCEPEDAAAALHVMASRWGRLPFDEAVLNADRDREHPDEGQEKTRDDDEEEEVLVADLNTGTAGLRAGEAAILAMGV